MSLELKNVEKKVGIETHIYSTNLKLEKNTINVLLGSTLSRQNNSYANYGWFRQTYIR